MKSYKGGLIDNRTEKKDFSHLEIGRATSPTYLTKSKALKVSGLYEKRNQKTTSSCGAHAGELAHSIDTKVVHEPAFIYRQRLNYPKEGMYHFDIGNIIVKGACLNKNIKKTEDVYNLYTPTTQDTLEAKLYTQKSFIVLEDNKFTIDDIAYTVNDLKRPLILFVFWNGKEWSTDFPEAKGVLTNVGAQYKHYVTVLPNSAYTYKKKKYVIIQDSSWFGGKNIRHLSEDWINKRIYTGLYFTDLITEEQPKLKHKGYRFTKDFAYGDSNPEVKILQETLQDLGFFPANIECTNYYGGISRQAVKDFQKKYEKSILWTIGLKLPTGRFGIKTREALNTLLS